RDRAAERWTDGDRGQVEVIADADARIVGEAHTVHALHAALLVAGEDTTRLLAALGPDDADAPHGLRTRGAIAWADLHHAIQEAVRAIDEVGADRVALGGLRLVERRVDRLREREELLL